MAYGSRTNSINYYSNPAVIHPGSGKPTGIAGKADNARVITENRFLVSEYGTENAKCGQIPGYLITS